MYRTHLYAQGAALAGTQKGFPSNKDRCVGKQCECTPISSNDLKDVSRLGSRDEQN